MGRLNVNQIKYLLFKFVSRIVPRKYRKPFYLIGGILGLITYFKFMLYWTKSNYLYTVQDAVINFKNFIMITYDHKLVYAVLALLVFVICFKYFRVPRWSGEGNDKTYNGSIYYQVNGLISILYAGITILAILPFVI